VRTNRPYIRVDAIALRKITPASVVGVRVVASLKFAFITEHVLFALAFARLQVEHAFVFAQLVACAQSI
jgi:hypothetical protein